MEAVKAQNEVLKQTQYDRALAMIKSQRELFDNERTSLQKRLADLDTSDKDKSVEIAQLQKRIAELDVFKRRVDAQDDVLRQMMEMMMQSSEKSPPPPLRPPPLPDAPGRGVTVKIAPK